MKSVLDNEAVDLACPQCGHKFRERLGKLKLKNHVTCAACKVEIPVDANQIRRHLQNIEKSLADINRAAGRIFK